MFADIFLPETLKPAELDQLLDNGWFRMGQAVFTTHFLCFNNLFYSAIWLRVNLASNIDDVKFRRLQKQNNRFRTEIKKAVVTPQHEALYLKYKQSISFEPSQTLQSLLYGFADTNRFNTYEVNAYDGDTLIATGFFDIGKESAAGIVSFYHPDYKKYSLGKYLIYLKMDFCKKLGLLHFYPGYAVPGYPPFDYKLSIGSSTLEYFAVSTRQWLPHTSFSIDSDPLKLMYKKLTELQERLNEKNSNGQILYYRFFDTNLDPHYSGEKLFDYPIFLSYLLSTANTAFKLIVFDICSNYYCILQCSSVVQTDWFKTDKHIFSDHLLQVDKIVFSNQNLETMIKALSGNTLF